MAIPPIEEFLEPISVDSPSGVDLRYHSISEQIKEARRREDEGNQGIWKRAVKEPDYKLVAKLCREALTKKGKDLQVAAWLTEAWLWQEGFPGLFAGLQLVRGLMDRFWDTLYPEIEDGDYELRATPLEWIATQLDVPLRSVPILKAGFSWTDYMQSKAVPSEERAGSDSAQAEIRQDAIDQGKKTPEEFEQAFAATPGAFLKGTYEGLVEIETYVSDLSAFCDERFGDASPNLGRLRGSIEEMRTVVRVLLVRKQEEEGTSADLEDTASENVAYEDAASSNDTYPLESEPVAASSPRTKRRGSQSTEPSDEADAIDRVLSAARFLRQQNPGNVAPYLLTRALRWGELRAAGSYPDIALLEPPPTQVRMDLRRLFHEGQYDQALATAEDAMGLPCGRAWLDLQRYSVRCAQYSGYDYVATAIKDALKSLLQSCPQLVDWTLSDDTPCANAETREWLREEGLVGGTDEVSGAVAPTDPAPPSYWDAPPPPAEFSSSSLGSEDTPPDVEQIALQAVREGRVQEAVAMLWREAAQETSGRGKFIRRSQLAKVCIAAGQQLVALPVLKELSSEIRERRLDEWEDPEFVARILTMLYHALGSGEESRSSRQELYERICQLDPMHAMEMGGRP